MIVEPLEVRYKRSIELSITILQATFDLATRPFDEIKHDATEGGYLCKGLLENLREHGWCPSKRWLIIRIFEDTSRCFENIISLKPKI